MKSLVNILAANILAATEMFTYTSDMQKGIIPSNIKENIIFGKVGVRHKNALTSKVILMSTNNILVCFYGDIRKMIPNYHQITTLSVPLSKIDMLC